MSDVREAASQAARPLLTPHASLLYRDRHERRAVAAVIDLVVGGFDADRGLDWVAGSEVAVETGEVGVAKPNVEALAGGHSDRGRKKIHLDHQVARRSPPPGDTVADVDDVSVAAFNGQHHSEVTRWPIA